MNDRIENQDTKDRIVKAALICVKRLGMTKITLNEIAQEAGVTRPTVYSYFQNRQKIVQYVLNSTVQDFVNEVLAHIAKFQTPQERVVENVNYCLRHLPSHPVMEILQKSGALQMINAGALTSPMAIDLWQQVGTALFNGMKLKPSELDEKIEIVARFTLSLLLVESPRKRSEKELRDFLRRCLLPSVGLHAEDKAKKRVPVKSKK